MLICFTMHSFQIELRRIEHLTRKSYIPLLNAMAKYVNSDEPFQAPVVVMMTWGCLVAATDAWEMAEGHIFDINLHKVL